MREKLDDTKKEQKTGKMSRKFKKITQDKGIKKEKVKIQLRRFRKNIK